MLERNCTAQVGITAHLEREEGTTDASPAIVVVFCKGAPLPRDEGDRWWIETPMLVIIICSLAAVYLGVLGYLVGRAPLPRWPKFPLLGLLLCMALWLGYAGYATPLSATASPHVLGSVLGLVALLGVGYSALWVSDLPSHGPSRWRLVRFVYLAGGVVGILLLLLAFPSLLQTPITLLSLISDHIITRGWSLWVLGGWGTGLGRLLRYSITDTGYRRLFARVAIGLLMLALLLPCLAPVKLYTRVTTSLLVLLLIAVCLLVTTSAVVFIAQHPTPSPRRVLRSGLVSVVAIGTLLGILAFLLPFAVKVCLFYFGLSPFHAVTIVIGGLLFSYPLVTKGAESLIRHLLFRSPARSPVNLPDIAQRLNIPQDRQSLVTLVTETLESLFLPQTLGLYLRDGDTLRRATSSLPGSAFPATLSLTDPRVSTTRAQGILVYPAVVAPADSTTDGAALVIPFTLDDTVLGLALIGPKCSGDVYMDADVAVCDVIRQQVAVALAHLEAHDRLCEVIATLDARVAYQTRELTEANARLREADQAKDQFLALVSHELLSPLTSILGWSDLPPTKRTLDTMTEALDAIQRSGLRQKRLVDDLLDVSRIIHGKLVVTCAPAELWTLVRHAVDDCQTQVAAKSITLVLTPPSAPLPVVVDSIRITQVISNLVQNAVKFTPDGGTVTLTGRQEATLAVVEVVDTGQGIAPEVLPHLFTAFIQAPQSPNAGGLGLGLAIVKGIIDLHGGQVTAESAGEGCGSRFAITLPLAVTPDLDAETAGRVSACVQQQIPEVMTVDEAHQLHARYGEGSPSSISLREALTRLPVETIDAMRTALQQGDILQLKALIEQVGADQPQLVQVLRMFADRYDYDKLHSLLAADDRLDGLTRTGDHHGDR